MRNSILIRTLTLTLLTAVGSISARAQTPTPPPLPPPVAFQDALLKAGNDLFTNANLQDAPDKVMLVIDPLIDGATGAQSITTQSMGNRLAELAKKNYPR